MFLVSSCTLVCHFNITFLLLRFLRQDLESLVFIIQIGLTSICRLNTWLKTVLFVLKGMKTCFCFHFLTFFSFLLVLSVAGRLHGVPKQHPRRGHHLQLRGQSYSPDRPHFPPGATIPQVPPARGGDPRTDVQQRRNLHAGGAHASGASLASTSIARAQKREEVLTLTSFASSFQFSRPQSRKAIFLITDGYSNGGDPRPTAELLKTLGVELFTFGIRNGNVKELKAMASDPKDEHCFIVDSFEEFEALARRALHEGEMSSLLLKMPKQTKIVVYIGIFRFDLGPVPLPGSLHLFPPLPRARILFVLPPQSQLLLRDPHRELPLPLSARILRARPGGRMPTYVRISEKNSTF